MRNTYEPGEAIFVFDRLATHRERNRIHGKFAKTFAM